MRKLKIIEQISLDGVIQAPGPGEDLGASPVAGVRGIKAKGGPDLIVWGS